MKFTPEQYKIKDEPNKPFIDADEIDGLLAAAVPTMERVDRIIARSLDKNRLTMEEVAVLINATDPVMINKIKAGAKALKEKVYGNRIVLFAPLYVGNLCSNNCQYCGFKSSNNSAVRKTLSEQELIRNVEALEQNGQKRLILVFGEHKQYSPAYIADAVRTVYKVKTGPGEIRRVNINAAPLDVEGYRVVGEAGIGTYQVFQETYHPEAYKQYHTSGRKADYNYRLTALDRAQDAGLDDVGIGALFGLYHWQFEVMGLIRHVNHLEACYNVGPHTISFPRLQDASEYSINDDYHVSDEVFSRIIAILRLAVPYTGMILTAREPASVRDEVLQYGCSQIDAGTRIEIGAYADKKELLGQNLNEEQFLIHDERSLAEVISELIDGGYLPSFCTACYRKGRTGEHFMEFSVPGFIKRYCTPNAILTLAEYLEDYADDEVASKGWALIHSSVEGLAEEKLQRQVTDRLEMIRSGKRDLYF